MGCCENMNKPGAIKVPIIITVWFWAIKILCTTVGESAADWLNETIGIGLSNTCLVMTAILAVTMSVQFCVHKYIPALYWLNVMFVSVVGTLVTDLSTDQFGVQRWIMVIVFTVLMLATFYTWYHFEQTLSIHSINTVRREAFYWLAVLFTFALGTAVGDGIAEGLNLGYWQALLVFLAAMAFPVALYYLSLIGDVLAFWLVYIITRPVGASLGDLLASDKSEGGAGLGPGVTSCIFLALIFIAVGYLTYSKVDVPTEEDEVAAAKEVVTNGHHHDDTNHHDDDPEGKEVGP